MKGETYFLRTYYYSLLVNYWVGVIMVFDSPNIDQINTKKSTKEEVYAKTEKDLNIAAGMLPVEPAEKGRLTQRFSLWTAHTCLSLPTKME